MPTAIPIQNDQKYPMRITRTARGLRGERYFLIEDAASTEDCLDAAGLPALGSSWSSARASLVASSIEPVPEGGPSFHVRVEYEEQAGSGGSITPSDGLVLTTDVIVESTSETIEYGKNVDTGESEQMNPDGVQKLQVAIAFSVISYHATLPDLNALLFLCNEPKVNDAPVILKNIEGNGNNIVCDTGTLLYAGFDIDRDGDYFRITHAVKWRRTWHYLAELIGQKLDGTGIFRRYEIYEQANFPAVFE